ncbi:MAG: peptidoglycan bridge formation glycyltransferase FemA/FemB family protein [Bacteroidota bacterium]|nr:peptidoglycan bridge formation glycyltransferase FemA/FemB family protein [Bacteroidota bacterium]
MSEYNILKLGDTKIWNEYLRNLPINQQDIYFTPEYYNLYENLGDGIANCFVYKENENIALYPFLKSEINALGYSLDRIYYDIQGVYGYNGIIASIYDSLFIKNFYYAFSDFCLLSNIVSEFSRFHPILKNHEFSRNNLNICFNRNTVYVDLEKPIELIIQEFTSSNNRAIRKAEKIGLTVKVYVKDYPYKDNFQIMYKKTMDRVNSIDYLYFNSEYFNSLFEFPELCQFVCFYENRPIASTVCFSKGIYFHYHLGASESEFLNLRPNNLLFFEMIKFAKRNNFKFLHFGGGNTSDPDDPLLHYKSNFSKNIADFYIGTKIYNEGIYNNIVSQWEKKFPEKKEKYKNFILKYHF